MEETLSIVSSDGASVRARVFAPHPEETTFPVAVLLPAMGVRAAYYEPFARALAYAGVPVVTVDLRGQGESSERAARGSSFGYREMVERDIPAAVSAARARFPDRSILLLGHSLGGQLATLSLSRGNTDAEALVLVASGTAHWRDWPRRSRRKTAFFVAGVSLAGRLLPWYPGRRLGFGGDQPRALMRDWSRNALAGRYLDEPRRREAPREAVAGVSVLSIAIEKDAIAPAGAVRSLADRFGPDWVSHVTIPSAGLGNHWQRHFDWAKRPATVVATMLEWMNGGALEGARDVRRAS